MDMGEIVSRNPILAIFTECTVGANPGLRRGGSERRRPLFEVALNSKDGLEQISLLRRRYGNGVWWGRGRRLQWD